MRIKIPRQPHQCSCALCQTQPDHAIARHHSHMNLLLSRLREPERRWYIGSLSQLSDGHTDKQLQAISGLSLPTIRRGRRELATGLGPLTLDRQRRPGGGRPALEKKIRP